MNRVGAILATGILALHTAAVATASPDYEKEIRPILAEYCNKCHSTEKQKGDLDLERFTSLSEVKKHPKIWDGVLEQLANKEMPPKEKPQLSPEQSRLLTQWIEATLNEIALASAGDPGPIILRRLSNAEYTYTIRDLTGVTTLDPAREFPVDGAAGEGFDNAGAALVMSPALLGKYLDAAKEIAAHAVLEPDGIRFSTATTQRDWTDEILGAIRAIYATHSGAGGATAVDLQGVKLLTNSGGRLPVERYIQVLRNHPELQEGGLAKIPEVARAEGISPKYLGLLWQALHDGTPSLLLDQVRAKYRAATPQDAAAVTQTIQQWQQYLWNFSSVGQIGKRNGPKGWQQPAKVLGNRHELRFKLTPPADGSDVTLHLAATRLDENPELAVVRWENARIVRKKKEDVPIRVIEEADGPTATEVKIPAALCKDAEFAVTARLAPDSPAEAGSQVSIGEAVPVRMTGFIAGRASNAFANGQWSDNNALAISSAPILVQNGSTLRKRFEAAFEDFRALFPAALCYTKIVPVDEVVTLTLFFREDEALKRLMLDDAEAAKLDRLWEELRFVSESPLKHVDVFEQLYQFATQDADPSAFEPMREPIQRDAEVFKKQVAEAEPKQLQAVLDLAPQVWRRPLTDAEQTALRALYHKLRADEQPHDAALRMTLARLFVSPAFLYRGEKSAPGVAPTSVNGWEQATRLSYFLWASAPDAELNALAMSGRLQDPEVLAGQAKRMLKDSRVSRLATEFGCQWLHVRDVSTLDEKSERHFPTFTALRGNMQEEVVRFFTDLFQSNRPALALLDANYTFLNGPLARHYGITVKSDDWQRIDGARAQGRGGILGFAATLAKQSGASRTSPILRGNWLTEVVLGERLPRPPKGVPILPDEMPDGLTERQLIERHTSDMKCASCHRRIDPYGFALEGFDAIGRSRTKDAGGLSVDTQVRLADGTAFNGMDGLRAYLLSARRDDFLRQFSRKLLGYALGRAVQLSDRPLIDAMVARLGTDGSGVADAIDLIVRSSQFREVRGRDFLTSN